MGIGGNHGNGQKQVKQRIGVGLSGGVASAVVAALLKNQGFDVIGVHLSLVPPNFNPALPQFNSACCEVAEAPAQLARVKSVCQKLDIPLHVIDASGPFESEVVEPFVHDALISKTNNPCVSCSSRIKVKHLLKVAQQLGCEQIATGHYARVSPDLVTGEARLYRGSDPQHEQSFYLFNVDQEVLKRLLMPLGGLSHSMLNKLAIQFELRLPESPQSSGGCIVDLEARNAFIESRTPKELRKGGLVKGLDQRILGDHDGLFKFTIGQKKGIPFRNPETEKYVVIGFSTRDSSLWVGHESDLLHSAFRARDAHWIRPMDQLRGLRCVAVINGELTANCLITHFGGGNVRVELEGSHIGVLAGLPVALYDGDEVLGGAYIDAVIKPNVDEPKVLSPNTGLQSQPL